jgi:predicted GIY-YIG superfamily endonuclease
MPFMNQHYVGLTADVSQRVTSRNAGQNRSTADDRPWTVLVSIEFQTFESASAFER